MTQLERPTAFPLAWPAGWDRTVSRVRAKFDDRRTRLQALVRLRGELERLGSLGEIISSNAGGLTEREPADPGVAVYFRRSPQAEGYDHVLACDRFTRVVDNVWALALTIEGMRQQERYGVATVDRALRAYRALPAPEATAPARPWFEVLRCREDAAEIEIRAAFKARCEEQHPDRGGGGDMAALARARDEGLAARRPPAIPEVRHG